VRIAAVRFGQVRYRTWRRGRGCVHIEALRQPPVVTRLGPLFLSLEIMRGKPSITIPEGARKRAIASIQRYFADNLELEIGDLKAALVLDYFLAEHGPTIYNKAIADARDFFDERAADLGAICYHAEFPFWDERKR
jgi:uncharacterized protein (DUF2164 family)